jgi:hypothetical protein
MSGADMNADIEPGQRSWRLASSSKKGYSCVFNFEVVAHCGNGISWDRYFGIPLPWNERHNIPVFRGVLWRGQNIHEDTLIRLRDETAGSKNTTFMDEFNRLPTHQKRLALVAYSTDHPDLVDAKATHIMKNSFPEWMFKDNATNGLHKILPFHTIPRKKYFSQYQVHIVMGGFGAAFRTPILFGQGVAVILQSFPWEEWYIQYMEPFVHYIPLAGDLSNLTETLLWVRDNPQKVHKVAMNGQAFYKKYLSWDAMEEFYYELVFRLSLKAMEQQQNSSSLF